MTDGEWLTKWDGAENTHVEPVKGGLSGALKRAGALWGVGRYLYYLPDHWAVITPSGRFWHGQKIKRDGKDEYVSFRWDPPALPDWALPGGSGVPPAEYINTETGEVGVASATCLTNFNLKRGVPVVIVGSSDEDLKGVRRAALG